MSATKFARTGEECVLSLPPAPENPVDGGGHGTNLRAESGSKVPLLPARAVAGRQPDSLRTRVDKVNAELVTLTYGSIVAQLCKDYDGDYVEVNKQLDKMGYNIGLRLIEDYLAKSNTMKRCANFRETADAISKVGRCPRLSIWLLVLMLCLGWLQDLLECHSHRHELDQRRQTVLPVI